MAEIDKSLTEVTKSVEIDGPEEQVELQEDIVETLPNAGETEITPTEDGGVEINFEPGAFNQAQSENHFDNLAELLPDDILGPLGSELNQNYMDYKESRKEWERTYITGLDLLGFKYEIEHNLSQVQQELHTRFLQKRLRSFKHWLTKNYSRPTDQ